GEAGVGEERRSGVGNQRNGLATGNAGDDLFGLGALVMFMQRLTFSANAVVVEELCRGAGIFAKDDRRRGGGLEGADGDGAQMADGGRNDIEAGRQGRRLKGRAGDKIFSA